MKKCKDWKCRVDCYDNGGKCKSSCCYNGQCRACLNSIREIEYDPDVYVKFEYIICQLSNTIMEETPL